MKKSRTAQLSSDLLVSKGAAGPSHATRETLGPDQIEQALRDARAHAGSGREPKPGEPGADDDGRVTLSIRLDPERHRRLKLATVHRGETAEGIMIEALDTFISRIAGEPSTTFRETEDRDQNDESDRAGPLVRGAPTVLD